MGSATERFRTGAKITDTRIPISVVIGRIGAIVGLSFAIAIGILLILTGTYWIAGVVSLLCALPFAGLLRFVEYRAERGKLRGSGPAA
ncbi:MAG TPA: hypothetical protein VH916_12380 [Dehalococcoidia bacterium]|jgi:hypothetical protein